MAGASITGNSVGADEGYQPPQVSAVFGEPVTVGDKTLIRVARSMYISGLGQVARRRAREAVIKLKFQEGSSDSDRKDDPWTKTPVAVIEISRGKVRVRPIVSPLRMALAGMLLGGWNVYWVLRTIRKWRARR